MQNNIKIIEEKLQKTEEENKHEKSDINEEIKNLNNIISALKEEKYENNLKNSQIISKIEKYL